jgi:nitrogen fixation NifU-like protein
MMDLRDLYEDIILDHGRNPRNLRAIEHPTHFAKGRNPLCGDQFDLYLTVEGGVITDLSIKGRGCAISTASASLLTEVLKGKTLDEADKIFHAFQAKITGGEAESLPENLEDDFDRLSPFDGVVGFPARVKCAALSWRTLEAALKSGGVAAEPVKTE